MEVVKGEKQNIILGKEASVNAVILTPPLIPSLYESCSLQVRSKG